MADAPPAPVVFRGKKRKFFRQRATDADNSETKTDLAVAPSDEQGDATAAVPSSADDEEGLSVAEILRRRNTRKLRLRGVGFGAEDAYGNATSADDELTLMIREEEQKALELSSGGMSGRFAAQTGLATELVNKHMMEYVESEIAKRHSAVASAESSSQDPSSSSAADRMRDLNGPLEMKPGKSSALQGKLVEIDLGDEARFKNEAMTDRARRKLQGEEVEEDDEASGSKKVKLGRDGKPWRPRNRRGSDAIQRDRLVEDFLRENRLDVYETPTPPPDSGVGPDDYVGAADDRIAEEFRREFMEAVAERHRKKRLVNAPVRKPGPKKDEEILRGPKLGGSRNARAAMRDILLAKEKEKAGKR
ncbi:hepatocellular carcinoma-associated antigen 59-domain-containing protein [Xylariales sp. PMI_506]|nr:hepatocellular carcinoma-associated antigen 59-domain-containing protein [Xylariales sp. PMI_506]